MSTYTITHPNGSSETIKGCKLEFNKVTGQTMIYDVESLCGLYCLVAVVPATSFVKLLSEAKAAPQREFANIETSKNTIV
jgi:hypothetical protein